MGRKLLEIKLNYVLSPILTQTINKI